VKEREREKEKERERRRMRELSRIKYYSPELTSFY
jgi:hypothetical protein